MDELEQKLKAMRLAAPSTDLDRRMDDVFSMAAARNQKGSRRPVFYWWLAAVTAGSGMAALFVVAPRRSPSTPETVAVVYHIEAQGRMRQMLFNPAASQDQPPRFLLRDSTP